jgi:hypothetical protein
MTKTEFQVAARQYLWLPPLKNPVGDSIELKCGCEVQKCVKASCRTKDLLPLCDVVGNHSLTCHPGVKAHKATVFEKALDKVFRVAGGHPTKQPSTFTLLGGYFAKEDINALFSGHLTKPQTEARKALAMQYLDLITELPPGQRGELEELRDTFPKPPASKEDTNLTIRFDLRFPADGPGECARELWFDHAIVHETSSTYAEETLRYLKDPDRDGALTEGPAFRKMFWRKINKYAALTAVAKRLSNERKIDFLPTFLYPIVSDLGFMNKDFTTLNKFIVDRFRDTEKKAHERLDGLSLKYLTGRFKVQMRNSLCFALLKGNALAAYNQGLRYMSKPP